MFLMFLIEYVNKLKKNDVSKAWFDVECLIDYKYTNKVILRRKH